MKIYLTLLVSLLANQLILAQVPTISGFSPSSGPLGTNVTITGNNFNLTPANNVVFFGAVRGIVTTASSTSLMVTVPAGTTFHPLTVTTNGLTASSIKPFIVTFPGHQQVLLPVLLHQRSITPRARVLPVLQRAILMGMASQTWYQ